MNLTSTSRRQFLHSVLGAACAGWATRGMAQEKPRHKVERIGIGAIGLRYQGAVIAEKASAHGDLLALCDVDQEILDKAQAKLAPAATCYRDYNELLARQDIDVILIGTPDHWHTKMLLDACRAGKDVYCEKPLTLTVDEGKRIRKVAAQAGRVVQVGSWQRSDQRFRLAVEMVRQGRIGNLQKVDVVLGKNKTGGPFKNQPVPKHFDWNRWQGQTPDVPYVPERTHYTFRWWYEYSGGQMTDWGAHHVDIAQWGIDDYPIEVSGEAKLPEIANGYNVAVDFSARFRYGNGVELTVSDTGRNGVMFTGTQGRIFVNRGVVAGKPVDDLADQPLNREDYQLYPQDNLDRPPQAGKLDAIVNHMGNFFDCVESRKPPISDVESQHRSVTTCHLANISMRLGRPLKWDPKQEQFVGDSEANGWLRRQQRHGFEIT